MINTIIGINPQKKSHMLLKCGNPDCIRAVSKHHSIIKKASPNSIFCCSHKCKLHPFVLEQHRNMTIAKYGVTSVFKLDTVKQKIKNTNIKKYGVDNPSKSPEIIKKIGDVMFSKYGVRNVTQSLVFKEKTKATLIKKYGSAASFHKMVKDKTLLVHQQKYGTWFFGSECGKMDRDSLIKNWGYTPEECDTIALAKLSNNTFGRSKISKDLFCKIVDNLEISERLKVLTDDTELVLHSLDSKKYFMYDFALGNKIIEFNGDYWHANPEKFDAAKLVRCGQQPMPAKFIWEKDKIKYTEAIKQGYTVYVIWERDYLNNPEVVLSNALKFLKNN